MRQTSIDAQNRNTPILHQMRLSRACHDHVCINYLVAMCSTVVCRERFRTASANKFHMAPKFSTVLSEFCLFQNKDKNQVCSSKKGGKEGKMWGTLQNCGPIDTYGSTKD